jgi:RNA polymerase sigma-70 factor (ECF subfamily)
MGMPVTREYEAEESVIDAIRGGDRYAFEEFVRRNHRWVRGVIFGVLGHRDIGDDVSQQVWTAFWQRIGELRDTASWKSWLYRMARNAAVDAGRELSRRKAAQFPAELVLSTRPGDPSADHEAVRQEEQRRVLNAIQGLPAIYREPFVLRHLNGWSYREIAELMNLPVDSVETRLVRARRFLRGALQEQLKEQL